MYPNHKALDEIERLEKISINNNPTCWDKEATNRVTKISFLNTRSLVNKFDNIKSDLSLLQSNFIIFAETWIPTNTSKSEQYQLKNFESHLNNSGRGKGLAIFYTQDIHHIEDDNSENISISKMTSEDLDIISVYRSKDGCLKKLVNKLQDIINYSKTTVIIGDMNICNKENPNNLLQTHLIDKSFKPIINEATHLGGGHIDHAYILNRGNFEDNPDVEIVPKYYSDHDSICISWTKKQTN